MYAFRSTVSVRAAVVKKHFCLFVVFACDVIVVLLLFELIINLYNIQFDYI